MAKAWKAALATMIGALACTFLGHKIDRDIPRDLWWFTITFGAIMAYATYEGMMSLIAVPKTRWRQYFKAAAPMLAITSTMLLFLLPLLYLLLRTHPPHGQSFSSGGALIGCALGGAAIVVFQSIMMWHASVNFTAKDAEDCYRWSPWGILSRTIQFCLRKARGVVAGFRAA